MQRQSFHITDLTFVSVRVEAGSDRGSLPEASQE